LAILGNASIIDCDIKAAFQELPMTLYTMACDRDDSSAIEDNVRGRQLAEQRGLEAQIMNESGMEVQSSFIEERIYGNDTVFVVDCPVADGGICALSELVPGIHLIVDRYYPSGTFDEIQMSVEYYNELQLKKRLLEIERQPGEIQLPASYDERVARTAALLSLSRFLFEHPVVLDILFSPYILLMRVYCNFLHIESPF